MADGLVLKPSQTIVFIGDSITDAGRLQRAYRPFGNGYVNFNANYLLAKYPQLNFRIVNTGINGNTMRDLERRWERDCLSHKPDVLSVLIGINDLWRTLIASGEKQGVQEYESTYQRLLAALRQQGDCQFVLMEPFMFCDDAEDRMFRGLPAYINAVHNIAEQFDAVLVTLQSAIDEKIKTVASDKWSDDMVHPYQWAHCWISQRWIEATKV
jgi:lysophospholipase L1-like esterase